MKYPSDISKKSPLENPTLTITNKIIFTHPYKARLRFIFYLIFVHPNKHFRKYMVNSENIVCKNCSVQGISIFSDLIPESRYNGEKVCKIYRRGEVLFQEGALPKGLFCVKSGKIKLSQLGTDGREQIVHLVHDGDAMGYRAILGNDVYSCTATAMEDSSVCFIPAADFIHLLETQPKLLLKIARILAEKLRESEYKITQMAHQPVRDRLIHVLFTLIENYGFMQDNSTINLIIKREDLANLAGTTRETATRILYDLQKQKTLALKGKHIQILNLKQLRSSYHSII